MAAPDSMEYMKEHSAALKLEYKIGTAFGNEMRLGAASGFDTMVFVLFELASAWAGLEEELVPTSKALSYTLASLGTKQLFIPTNQLFKNEVAF